MKFIIVQDVSLHVTQSMRVRACTGIRVVSRIIDENISSSLKHRDELFFCLKTQPNEIIIEKEYMQ